MTEVLTDMQLDGIRAQFERNKGQNDAVKARWVEAYGERLLQAAEAAPDLLSAGQAVLNSWEQGDLAGAVNELRQAIAQAEGSNT